MGLNLKTPLDRQIYSAAAYNNILPLTSLCNVKCVFCSNLQNPPGVKAYNIKPRSLQQIKETLALLDSSKPITIGESVTRINEGEPFTHPQIDETLLCIRKTFPGTPIQITTNGSLLDKRRILFLKSLSPITVYLSMNSADVAVRKRLMRDSLAASAIEAANLLSCHGLEWHGSIVAMPHLTGWPELGKTVKYLAQCGAQTIRIFIPGFTKLAPQELRFPPSLPEQLKEFVLATTSEIQVPLTLEPPMIRDLHPEINGVILDSPAYAAGLRRRDLVTAVNGKKPFSRVEAFYLIRESIDPVLEIQRESDKFYTKVVKKAGQTSGIVMDYDIDPYLIQEIEHLQNAKSAGNIWLMASEMAEPILLSALNKSNLDCCIQTIAVCNHYFGGSIGTAGLLVLDDIQSTIQSCLSQAQPPDLIIIPSIALNHEGLDLTGRNWQQIENVVGIPVELI